MEKGRTSGRVRFKAACIVFLLFAALLGIADAMMFSLGVNNPPPGSWLLFFIFGVLSGQTALIVLVAGWGGEKWISGFTLAMILGTISLLAFGVGLLNGDADFLFGSEPTTLLWGLYLVPTVLFAGALPFWLVRFFSGRHLAYEGFCSPRSPVALQDYFLITAFIGIQFYLCTIPMYAWQVSAMQGWLAVAVILVGLSCLSLLIALPTAAIGFSASNLGRAAVNQVAYGLLTCLIANVAYWALDGPAKRITGFIFIVWLGGYITFAVGTWLLRFAGFRLVIPPNPQARTLVSPSPWEDATGQVSDASAMREELQPADRKWNWAGNSHWASLALLFLFAFSGVVSHRILQSSRLAKVDAYNGIGRRMIADGGEAFADFDHHIIALEFGPETTNEDLLTYVKHSRVSELDLSGTKIDDGVFKTLLRFKQLESLNLANTNCSVEALKGFLTQKPLKVLGLAGWSLSEEKLRQILAANPSPIEWKHLDISECGLTYEELESVWPELPSSVALRGYQLTDEQVNRLVNREVKISWDLRNNNLTGEFLCQVLPAQDDPLKFSIINPVSTWQIRLEGNPLTDKAIQDAAATRMVYIKSLSIGNNHLTDRCLDALAELKINNLTFSEIDFSETAFEDFLKDPRSEDMLRLAIHDPEFKGMDRWRVPGGLYQLDLSYSGVTSKSFAHYRDNDLTSLDLSHTDVDDDVFRYLGFDRAGELNLRHTQISPDFVSAQNVVAQTFLGNCRVALGQFSNRDVLKLQRNIRLLFNIEGPALHWRRE